MSYAHPDSMRGHVAIVTGGAQGMGAHFAKALLEAGAQVAVGDVKEEALAALPKGIHTRKLDVSKEEDVIAFVASDAARFVTGQSICVDGGQSLAIKLKTGDKMIDSNAIIGPLKPRMWQPAEINLKDIGGVNTTIDTVLFQGQADAYKPYYITKIQFE